jgi:ribosomal protein L7Ae-like RNA K-turn-binding protein
MKKTLAFILSLALVLMVFAGCSSKTDDAASSAPAETAAASSAAASEATAKTSAQPAEGGAVKTGLAVVTSVAKSTDAGTEDGLAETDSTVVAVTVDKDGKIVKCAIDMAQTKINFSAQGKITTPLDTAFKSKQELGADYGMGKASSIGKEWFEQANAFAAYAQGKTVDEIKGIAVNEEGVPSDAELASSVTIHIGDFVAAIEKAVANAQDLGATSADKLGLGIATNIGSSADAADKDGVAQAYSTYAATTFDASGKITSSVIDASQANVNFSAAGKITSDLTAAVQSKDELGEAYGLKKASSIGKEWNEQAAAFAKYAAGKTVDEVKGVAVNEEGVPSDAELSSSVTVHVGDFIAVIEKGFTNAK